MVEGARLESVYTRKGIEGSNPSLSAGLKSISANVVKTRIYRYIENYGDKTGASAMRKSVHYRNLKLVTSGGKSFVSYLYRIPGIDAKGTTWQLYLNTISL